VWDITKCFICGGSGKAKPDIIDPWIAGQQKEKKT